MNFLGRAFKDFPLIQLTGMVGEGVFITSMVKLDGKALDKKGEAVASAGC